MLVLEAGVFLFLYFATGWAGMLYAAIAIYSVSHVVAAIERQGKVKQQEGK